MVNISLLMLDQIINHKGQWVIACLNTNNRLVWIGLQKLKYFILHS